MTEEVHREEGSSGGVSIRDSTEGDVEGILRIYDHYVRHSASTFEETTPSLEEMHRRRRDVLASGLPFIVAEQDGTLCVHSNGSLYLVQGGPSPDVSAFTSGLCVRRAVPEGANGVPLHCGGLHLPGPQTSGQGASLYDPNGDRSSVLTRAPCPYARAWASACW